jgi:oligopeptide transport system substrate-binding protein
MGLKHTVAAGLVVLLGAGCGGPWNHPYPAEQRGQNILYSAFTERPKHLDPVQSYVENEAVFTAQIYMPPLQYHWLRRPYELIPLGAARMPLPRYFDASGRRLPDGAPAAQVAYTLYEIELKPGMRYQPHPAFARTAQGSPAYIGLSREALARYRDLPEFSLTGTREVEARDYVYQIKRLAHPWLHSPIFGLMSEYIVGLKEYAQALQRAAADVPRDAYLDLDRFDIEGVRVIDRRRYEIRIRGKYPQFLYWLAMPFFAPVPAEAERFYRQPGMAANLSLDWYPVGSGPFMLTMNNPNRVMIMERNPNFSGEPYPSEGEAQDVAAGLLQDAGKPMPFLDKIVFALEKESIPYWNKFLQGYYDISGISSDSFDQTIAFGPGGEVQLTEQMRARNIRLQTAVSPSTIYIGFNMLDPTVGGASERARKLRHAVSVALDIEEFVSIFRNGRGVTAHGPIPPGIFGYQSGERGINRHVYDWVDGRPRRKPVEHARRLLAEAGYPEGIDSATGRPLVINFDTYLVGPEGKARADWLIKQFQKINLQLVVRNTDFNRFQEKLRKGTTQVFLLGWNADYPDPENFLFLFHGPQSRAQNSGENAANYSNPRFDALFEQMRNMENGPQRQAIIDRMIEILRFDAPWAFGFHPADYSLAHGWVYNRKPNKMANNGLKYLRVDSALREAMRARWNAPVLWPLLLVGLIALAVLIPGWRAWRRREHSAALPQEAG